MGYPTDNPIDGRGAQPAPDTAAMAEETARNLLRASRRALSAMEGIADGMRDVGMSNETLAAEIERFRAAIAATEAR